MISLGRLTQVVLDLGKYEAAATKLQAFDFANKISQWKYNLLKFRNELQEKLDQKAGVTTTADVAEEIYQLFKKFDSWSLDQSQKKKN